MSKRIGSESEFRDSFLEGAARTIFVLAYASHVEEGDSTDNDLTDEEREARQSLPSPGGGQDWMDYAPPTPPNAYALAGQMWEAIERASKASMYMLGKRAAIADGGEWPNDLDGEEFGSDLAMQWAGTGASWFDDHAKFEITIPHAEISGFTFSDDAYAPEET